MKKLVFYMLWLTCHNICVECVEESDKAVVASDSTTKAKRYLHHGVSHDSSSPCPPFYPHFHTSRIPMHAIKSYGPPPYPKPIYGPPVASHAVQYIHQPTYMSYVPKQTVSYVHAKPQVSMPLYHYLPPKPMVHHDIPIQHLVKQQAQWQYQPHLVNYEKPHFAYAPTYHKPMIQQVSYVKGLESSINYHPVQATNFIAKPGIVYKSESHYCEPCHQTPLKPLVHKPLPQIVHAPPSYVKPVVHHPAPIKPASYYLPAQSHPQLPIIKHSGHEYPCSK
ncbi:early nodulin-75-like [Chelonus insularis]|uniref:early nodulin-75-like n=1 Tax=Chelonus insularis TaxID=460826 RepID=UPI00158866C6|nr:early nodulin-75-like [Chelonus insularis]